MHVDFRFPTGPPLNGCGRCGRDFASLAAFDAHHVGDRSITFVPSDPSTHDGFRCLDVEEEADWVLDDRGRWTTAKLAAKAKRMGEHFASSRS